jgi:hypothetical protein
MSEYQCYEFQGTLYFVRLLKPAIKELEKLDATVAKRIADRIEWLAATSTLLSSSL